VGGHGRTVTVGGLRFCMGPQYVWDFGEGGLGQRFLAHLGIEADNPVVEAAGGSVELGRPVVGLTTDDGRVTAAVTDDGTAYPCDCLFSDLSPRLTAKLLGRSDENLDYEPSHCIPICCLGLRPGLPAVAAMAGRNYWWQDGNEVAYDRPDVTAPPRMLFVASPTANGFGREAGADLDGLVVFCPGHYEQERSIHDRGAEAATAFRAGLARHVVEILDRNVFPGMAERVVFAEVLTSVDIERRRATSGAPPTAGGCRWATC